jgi:hypothetical protein
MGEGQFEGDLAIWGVFDGALIVPVFDHLPEKFIILGVVFSYDKGIWSHGGIS